MIVEENLEPISTLRTYTYGPGFLEQILTDKMTPRVIIAAKFKTLINNEEDGSDANEGLSY